MPKRWNDSCKRGLLRIWCFCRIYWKLGRRTPPWTYLYRCLIYQRKIRAATRTMQRNRLIGAAETAASPDNSADLEGVTYVYRGLDEVKTMIAEGKPLVFITWHQGAVGRNYGLARVLPETAIFTRETFQYGRVFSVSMLKARGLSLVKIERFLQEGRPIKYSIDGIPLGHTVRLPILGIPAHLSTAPIRIMRSVKGVRLVPVTCYFRDGDVIELTFHPPHPPPERLPGMSDRELLEALISFLEQDLMDQAPEQVRWRVIMMLERTAEQTRAEGAVSLRESP